MCTVFYIYNMCTVFYIYNLCTISTYMSIYTRTLHYLQHVFASQYSNIGTKFTSYNSNRLFWPYSGLPCHYSGHSPCHYPITIIITVITKTETDVWVQAVGVFPLPPLIPYPPTEPGHLYP